MVKAVWNDVVIAESNETVVVEGNHYFPPDSLNHDALAPSDTTSACFWKGKANYYHVTVGGETNRDAAWYYAEPKRRARNIKNHVAFWHGVKVTDS